MDLFDRCNLQKRCLLSHLMAYTLSVERISVREETYKSSSRSETLTFLSTYDERGQVKKSDTVLNF